MPRPTISGTLIRRIDMNHTGVTSTGRRSNKDYRITISVDAGGEFHLYTEYGPAGHLQNGEEHALAAPRSASSVNRRADELRDLKKNKRDSYQVVNDQDFGPAQAASPNPITTPVKASPPKPLKSIASLSEAVRSSIHPFF